MHCCIEKKIIIKNNNNNKKKKKKVFRTHIRNTGRDISFPIFTRKEVETKKIGKEIKTIISRLNDLSSYLSNIELKQEN